MSNEAFFGGLAAIVALIFLADWIYEKRARYRCRRCARPAHGSHCRRCLDLR